MSMVEAAGWRFGRRAAAWAVAAALAVAAPAAALLGAARPAAAEAFLVATTPSHGSVVTTAPQEVVLIFSERVDVVGDGVAVVGPGGVRVDPGTVRRPRPEVVSVALPGVVAVTRQGTYTVSWHVVSADSRPASGAFTFAIGSRQGSGARAAGLGAGPVVTACYGVAGFAALAGFVMLIGGVTMAGSGGLPPHVVRRLRGLAAAGWVTVVAATLAALALRGPYAAGAGPARAADRDLLGQTLHTAAGRALAARLVLLGAGAMLLEWGAGRAAGGRRDRRRRAALGVAAAVALALTWTAAGEAAAPGAPPLALPAAVVALLATGTWLGWLAALPVALHGAAPRRPAAPAAGQAADPLPDPLPARRAAVGAARAAPPGGDGPPESATLVDPVDMDRASQVPVDRAALASRFGRLTAGCAVAIAVAGGYQAWRQLDGAGSPVATAAGRLRIAELALLAGTLAVAIVLRARLRRSGGRGGAPRRWAAMGAALGALVLVPATALPEVRPAALARAGRPVTLAAHAAAATLSLRLPRALRGVDGGVLTVESGGGPYDPPGLRGAWRQQPIGVGPLPVRATRLGAGRYRLDWPPLPVAGGWRLAIDLAAPGRAGPAAAFAVRVR
jgi:copper transport protein